MWSRSAGRPSTMARKDDIRFDGRPVEVEHQSARGQVVRNMGDFTRGSQLLRLRYMMMAEGLRWPTIATLTTFVVMLLLLLLIFSHDHDDNMIEMRALASFWSAADLDPSKSVNLTTPDGTVVPMTIGDVPYDSDVAAAWARFTRCIIVAMVLAGVLSAPATRWFIKLSSKVGSDVLKERHERGATLVKLDVLISDIDAHNLIEMRKEIGAMFPQDDPDRIIALGIEERSAMGVHVPYTMAGVPYPWHLEQGHAMLIGTTGTGKTTQLRDMVTQARARGQRCVIFDLTGAFVESFYDPERDHILNPMDERCPPWTIFNDCINYADYLTAAAALIPSDGGNAEPFWAMAARTLFVEMCMKLVEMGETSNGAIAHHLMQADLKSVNAKLEGTIASPLTAVEAARMAESIRAVFNTNAQAIRFLPDPVPGGPPPFSITKWMREGPAGSILFITSTHNDLVLCRALLTLWMEIAVNAIMALPRTRQLRTWYFFDEVHALHRLPAIENGLQTARSFGGAFVLGMHSFDKLAETYGEEGAINLGSLARTKLILATADKNTAQKCSEYIGDREVRETDEAYSIGASQSRDAATITPRTEVKPLVIPDDLMNLPSLHGYVKFPEGFPATRIELEYVDYPVIAPGFLRKTKMLAAAYVPKPVEDDGETGEGGRENAGAHHEREGEEPGEGGETPDETALALSGLPLFDARAMTSADAEPAPPGDMSAALEKAEEDGSADLGAFGRIKADGEDNSDRSGDQKGEAGLRGLADEKGQSNRPGRLREQQIITETRMGQGMFDPADRHGHTHDHGAPAASRDGGMDMDF
nr:type IV secretion system DNA-binding domain-containing protein [Novosphingobium terrae]